MDRYEEAMERAKAGKPMDEVFPELKESEGEKIIEELIGHCKDLVRMNQDDKVMLSIYEPWLAWIEKQKENPKNDSSISTNCASSAKCENEHNKPGDFVFELRQIISRHWYADMYSEYVDDEEGMAREILSLCEKQKEQKPPIAGNDFGWIDELKQDLEHPEELDRKVQEALKKRQKPAEYLDKDKVYAIMSKLHNLSFSQMIPINSDEFKKISEITSDVRSLLDYPIEQKLAEWSEEDEKNSTFIVAALDAYNRLRKDNNNSVGQEEFDRAVNWIRHRFKSLRPQPKQEWSEEDERMVGTIISDGSRGVELDSKQVAWLKSLRSRPNWKPSEKQMKALNKVANEGALLDLFNDLLNKYIL